MNHVTLKEDQIQNRFQRGMDVQTYLLDFSALKKLLNIYIYIYIYIYSLILIIAYMFKEGRD